MNCVVIHLLSRWPLPLSGHDQGDSLDKVCKRAASLQSFLTSFLALFGWLLVSLQ